MFSKKANLCFISLAFCFAMFALFLAPSLASATINCGQCTEDYCRICEREVLVVNVYGVARRVANASNIDLFVPVKNATDWDNFRNNYATEDLPPAFVVAPSACVNGKYWDENIQWWANLTTDLACASTPCGYWSGNEDDGKHACSVGSYQSSVGQTSCVPASAGYMVAGEAACSQTACSAGSYQPNTGQISCISASAGYFVPSSSAISQTPCSAGTYQSNTGQSSCLACSTCRWSAEAATSCYVVSDGTDPGTHCSSSGWACSGSCGRARNSGVCQSGSCGTEYQNCGYGEACSGGSCSSGYCEGGGATCDGSCRVSADALTCNGSGSCNVSTSSSYNCPSGTACSNGGCTSNVFCNVGGWTCPSGGCSKYQSRYHCDGSNSCTVSAAPLTEPCPSGTACGNYNDCFSGSVCGSTTDTRCHGDCSYETKNLKCDGGGGCTVEAWEWTATCPFGTVCNWEGKCWSSGYCALGPEYCTSICTSEQKRYQCDGFAFCNVESILTRNCGGFETCVGGGGCSMDQWFCNAVDTCNAPNQLQRQFYWCGGGNCVYYGTYYYICSTYCQDTYGDGWSGYCSDGQCVCTEPEPTPTPTPGPECTEGETTRGPWYCKYCNVKCSEYCVCSGGTWNCEEDCMIVDESQCWSCSEPEPT